MATSNDIKNGTVIKERLYTLNSEEPDKLTHAL